MSLHFFMIDFAVLTAASAASLLCENFGELVTYLNSYLFANFLNSVENCVPQSLRTTLEMPNLANKFLQCSIISISVMDFNAHILKHLDIIIVCNQIPFGTFE